MSYIVVGREAYLYETIEEIYERSDLRDACIIDGSLPIDQIYRECVNADPEGKKGVLEIARTYEMLPSWCIFQTPQSVIMFVYQGLENMWCEEHRFDEAGESDCLPALIEAVEACLADQNTLGLRGPKFGPYLDQEEMREAFHNFWRAYPPQMLASSSAKDRCFTVWPSIDSARKLGATITIGGRTEAAMDYAK